VSYSREDQLEVQRFVRGLNSLGHETWFDRDLTGGQPWWDTILERIRASDAVIVALSPTSASSEAVRAESTYAGAVNRTVIPILLDPAVQPSQVSLDLANLHWINLTADPVEATFELVRAIRDVPEAAGLPDPLPEPPPVPGSYFPRLQGRLAAPQLSLADQQEILLQIRQRMREGAPRAELQRALETLRNRGDTQKVILDEVDETLERVALLPDSTAHMMPGTTTPAGAVTPTRETAFGPVPHLDDAILRHWTAWLAGEPLGKGNVYVRDIHGELPPKAASICDVQADEPILVAKNLPKFFSTDSDYYVFTDVAFRIHNCNKTHVVPYAALPFVRVIPMDSGVGALKFPRLPDAASPNLSDVVPAEIDMQDHEGTVFEVAELLNNLRQAMIARGQ
jgi:hypothetical protein